jgi:hypothetical protein
MSCELSITIRSNKVFINNEKLLLNKERGNQVSDTTGDAMKNFCG